MVATNLKPGFRTEIRDFCSKSEIDFEAINPFQKSQWMTRAYLERVLRRINPGLLPDDEEDLASCMTDGAGDVEADFICRQDGHVLVIQSKYRGAGKTESPADFERFSNVLSRLHPSHINDLQVNERVRDIAADIDWENDTFDLQFVTTGRATDEIRLREQDGQINVDFCPGLADRVELSFLEESDLNQRLREAQSANEQIAEPVDLRFSAQSGGPPWLKYENESGRCAYIGYVNAAQFRNLYSRHKYRLFAQNIRNYVGDTSTNKGIVETALDEPDSFFFYNNGVACIATAIAENTDAGILRLERFSIINGAQTVRSLAKAHTRNAKSAGLATVLVRVSEVSLKRDDSEEEFLDKITRFNNTQNAVKVSDFRSNDPIQRGLAKKFKQVSRGGKEYWYKNKRTADKDPRRISIGMEDFAKTVFAFRIGPADALGGTRHLFDTSSGGGYAEVFGVDGHLPSIITEDQFELLAGTWFLCDALRRYLEEEKERLTEAKSAEDAALVHQALERRWLFYYVVGETLRRRYEMAKRSVDEDLRRLSKPKWLDEATGPNAALSKYARVAAETLVKLYRIQVPGIPHRNWFRSIDTLKGIKSELEYSSLLLETLPLIRN